MSYAFDLTNAQRDAFKNRVLDALVKVKQELGVDELLLAIDDAKKIASSKVADYLQKYRKEVSGIIERCDEVAQGALEDFSAPDDADEKRSARNIEKLVAMTWKNLYEIGMTDLNSRMPLAQQIVSKYMANFAVKPSMK